VAGIQTLQLDAEAMDLADAYIAAGVIAPNMRADGYNSINLRREGVSDARDSITEGGVV
jgi:hypothetical protein